MLTGSCSATNFIYKSQHTFRMTSKGEKEPFFKVNVSSGSFSGASVLLLIIVIIEMLCTFGLQREPTGFNRKCRTINYDEIF